MKKSEMMSQSRRNFLRAAPVAAAGGLALGPLLAKTVSGQSAAPLFEGRYDLISAESLVENLKALEANPGTKHIFGDQNLIFDLTVEKAASAKEFEWHEGRDHVFHILDGATTYELGGTPQNAHGNGPGEWLAPASAGATKVELKKGDRLIVRRGTPHRRTTAASVTFTLTTAMERPHS